jgi:UDP-N-acetylmuramoyl-L-alanyl-D-glutamate--2,6-diaminopimelate ligase
MTRDFVEKLFKDYNIQNICTDSRAIIPNTAFFLIANSKESKNYINKALDQDVSLIFTDFELDYKLEKVIYVKDLEEILYIAASIIYNIEPKYKVAITGTNGKSSIASYFAQICEFLGQNSASIGTLGVTSSIANLDLLQNLTTEDFITNKKNLNILAKNNINYVCMEASSHGLAQKRFGDIKFNSAGFISFSQDHLDYHKSMEDYLESKLILFKNHLAENGKIVINKQINNFYKITKYLEEECSKNIISVGYADDNHDIDCEILEIESTINISIINFKYKNKLYRVESKIVGSFQFVNILIAAIMAENVGFYFEDIVNIIPQLKAPKGRLEKIEDTNIFIDYAHSPESLEFSIKELLKLKSNKKSKLITLFGCGGDRDKSKRSLMGTISANLSDITIITDDNPRNENPISIRSDILTKIKNQNNVIEISGRELAIKNSIDLMGEYDILLIAGKGHEKFQIIGDQKFEFDEFKIIKNYLQK